MRVSKTEGVQRTRDAGLPETVEIDSLLLSQSGSIAEAKDGHKPKPLVPGMAGKFNELVVIGLSPTGTRFENRFPIDEQGKVKWAPSQPLGHVPYQLVLVGKDGSKYTADVDISPSKTKVSHQGYEELKGISFKREPPPKPALPDQVTVGQLLLSQSGQIALARDGEKQKPLVAGMDGTFRELVVTGMSPSGTRFENRFPVDEKGMLQWRHGQPLGHVPYRLTLVAEDGTKYQADVNITPSKIGKSHQGYEILQNLAFKRVDEEAPASFDGAGSASKNELANGKGAVVEKPTLATSPVGIFFKK